MSKDITKLILEHVVLNRKRDLLHYLGRILDEKSHEKTVPIIRLEHVKETVSLVKKGAIHENVYFQACDLYIRNQVEPLQQVFNNWMSGAKAQVNGDNIQFLNIISWCQEQHKKALRDLLEREARSLCRFLSPFSQATWKKTFKTVSEDLGYQGYIDFLAHKKGRERLEGLIRLSREFLSETFSVYQDLVETWFSLLEEPVGPGERSRFDAIYLLGLRYLDHLYPLSWKADKGTENVMGFFGPFLKDSNALILHIGQGAKGQSCCLPVQIPGEIHVITGTLGGWIDLEALFHELGHAFFFLNNDEKMDVALKDFFVDFALGETFAFLFQLISMDREFLVRIMGLDEEHAGLLSTLQSLKFFTLARRYGAKSLIEYENFSYHEGSKGSQKRYAEVMKEQTGFRYHAETYYFDLMPDLYSLDYFQAFLGAWMLRDFLRKEFGKGWFLKADALGLLKEWSFHGNKLDLATFLKTHTGHELGYQGFKSYLSSEFTCRYGAQRNSGQVHILLDNRLLLS